MATMLGNAQMLQQISNFSIGCFDKCISDAHAPLHLNLHCNKQKVTVPIPTAQKTEPKFIWKKDKGSTYRNTFNPDELISLRHRMEDKETPDQQDINEFSDEIISIFKASAVEADLVKNKTSKKPAKCFEPW